MEDIAPKLLERIRSAFEDKCEKDGKMKALKEKLKKGEAAYKDAHTFAIESGSMLSEAFLNNLSSDVLPDGSLPTRERLPTPRFNNRSEPSAK